jgi:hypothetical protein
MIGNENPIDSKGSTLHLLYKKKEKKKRRKKDGKKRVDTTTIYDFVYDFLRVRMRRKRKRRKFRFDGLDVRVDFVLPKPFLLLNPSNNVLGILGHHQGSEQRFGSKARLRAKTKGSCGSCGSCGRGKGNGVRWR